MAADTAITCGLAPMHPGELLREEILPALKAQGIPRTEVAKALGVSRRTFYDILEERLAISPEMAVKLQAVLGTSAEMWANLQQSYDLAKARERLGPDLPSRLTADAA